MTVCVCVCRGGREIIQKEIFVCSLHVSPRTKAWHVNHVSGSVCWVREGRDRTSVAPDETCNATHHHGGAFLLRVLPSGPARRFLHSFPPPWTRRTVQMGSGQRLWHSVHAHPVSDRKPLLLSFTWGHLLECSFLGEPIRFHKSGILLWVLHPSLTLAVLLCRYSDFHCIFSSFLFPCSYHLLQTGDK